MKTSVKLIIGAGILILFIGVAGICLHRHYAHRGMRGMWGTAYYQRPSMNHRQMWGRDREAGMQGMKGMQPRMERGEMNGMRHRMGPGMMNRMGRGMGPMAMNHMGQGNIGPGRFMDMIPNLTEKQKKDIAELRKTQQDEMIKLNDEMTNKMQDLRQANRKKIIELLTPEQKKVFESHTGIPEPDSPEQK